jgi:hypothetical protein
MRHLMISTALAGAMLALPASAAILTSIGGTVSAGQGQVSSVGGTTNVNFGAAASALPYAVAGIGTYTSTNGQIVVGTVTDKWETPFGDTTAYLVTPSTGTSGTVTFKAEVGKIFDYFGLYWGSVDDYNSIAFFRNGTQIGATYTGANFPPIGGLTGAAGSKYINFDFTMGDFFDEIRLTSTNIAFESDNHAFRAARVSEPMTVGLLGAGLLGLALMRRRRG